LSLYLNACFSNYFVQILIIRSKCQRGRGRGGGAKMVQGERKNSRGAATPPASILPAPVAA